MHPARERDILSLLLILFSVLLITQLILRLPRHREREKEREREREREIEKERERERDKGIERTPYTRLN